MTSQDSSESMFKIKYGHPSNKVKNMTLDTLLWCRKMFDSSHSKIYEKDFTRTTEYLSTDELIDPDLQQISQKVMRKTWDNKEDEFWDTY